MPSHSTERHWTDGHPNQNYFILDLFDLRIILSVGDSARFIDANVLPIIFKGSNPGRVLISVESLEPLGAPKGSNLTNRRKTNCHLTKRHDAHFLSGVCQTPNKEEVHFDR